MTREVFPGVVAFDDGRILTPNMVPGQRVYDEELYTVEGNEWRTPPLWGLRYYEIVNGHDRLLHDGRARGVAEAILWHGGEAEASREAFRSLPRDERELLVDFVESL